MVIASQEVTCSIVEAIKRNLTFRHYRVFYFGSRVTGKATNRSDYDVGIEAEQKIPLEIIFKIEEEFEELPILQKIDFVDFKSVSKGFYKLAKENIEIIYSNKFEDWLLLLAEAISRLADVLKQEKSNLIRDSAIQRFKATFELVWKTLKAYLEEEHAIEARSPRESLCGAFQIGLLDEDPQWIETIKYRNLISHTYNEAIAEEIYQALPQILALYQDLLKKLKTPS